MNAPVYLPVEIFPMNGQDLEAVAALEAGVQDFPWSRGNFADSLEAGHDAWVCRIGGDLVGFAVVMVVLDEAHLLNIAVAGHHQGRGHGARLLRHAMNEAGRQGASRLLLEVRACNGRAMDLYRLFGFKEIGRRRDYYPARQGREDALVFEREIRWP